MTTIYDDCSKEELLQIVSEMQKVLNDSKKENKELQRIINDLQSDLVGATNDYKQAVNEVKLLNKQCDKLIAENNDLKHRRKILVKHLLNIMYGFDYADTDSEDKNADKKCTYKETGCGSCKWQLDCPIEADKTESEDKE